MSVMQRPGVAVEQDQFRLLVDSLRDQAIYMLDAGGVVTSWSAGAEALIGYTAAEIVGQRDGALFPAADREIGSPARLLAAAAAAGRCADEGPRVRKDGSQFWAEAVVTAIRGADDQLVGYANVVRDLTERRQIEAERRAHEERFRALARATPDAIVTADHHGTITYANHATAALFGRAATELVGQPLTALMPERLRDAHRAGLARFLATGEGRILGRTVELPALRSDGTELEVEMSIGSWTSRGEISFAAIIRDISERKRIAATLAQRTRQLEDANRELEAFSYSVAHDLRAPLRGTGGLTQILLEDHADTLDPQAVGFLTRIRANVIRMAGLIDALLELSQASRGELELEPVDLSAVARSVLHQLVAAEPDRAVAIDVTSGMRVTADARLVRTVLENLLGNAWKFTARTAEPQIAVGTRDGRTFFVRDNGAGFNPAAAAKLFSPFERLHSADQFPGTGIGLATVQRIVHRHGGRIWADAQIEAGATFYFTLAPP